MKAARLFHQGQFLAAHFPKKVKPKFTSIREAARASGIDEKQIRYYCGPQKDPHECVADRTEAARLSLKSEDAVAQESVLVVSDTKDGEGGAGIPGSGKRGPKPKR